MNILTFDIEEWYIYSQYPKGGRAYYKPILDRYLNDLLDLLEGKNTIATFFCLGEIAAIDPEVIRLIHRRGHEIGAHSNLHHLVSDLSPTAFREDTYAVKARLEDLTGEKVEYYRAPAFSITEKTKWALDILMELGFTCDSSIFPAARSFGGYAQLDFNAPIIVKHGENTIKEFPINFSRVGRRKIMYSGGGYFRILPYFMIKKWMEKTDYNMLYFHLRDFDAEQKRVVSARYFQSYYGVNRAYAKFRLLSDDFDFISLGEAIKRVDWESAEQLDISGVSQKAV
jgi:polysaccharide deacetylase family protein (PEP-CTERM system associated)